MPTDLALHIENCLVADTHEHTRSEADWIKEGPPDVLADLFSNYSPDDLVCAGMSREDVLALVRGRAEDVEKRWNSVKDIWPLIRHTGYGQAVALAARELYGMDELSLNGIQAAEKTYAALRRPGQQLPFLKNRARLDHVQVNDMTRKPPVPDADAPDFYLYDLSLWGLAKHDVDYAQFQQWTGVTATNLASLEDAMVKLFEKSGRIAIACKTQHAYTRSLAWRMPSYAQAEEALSDILLQGAAVNPATRALLGDWCLHRCATLAGEYGLPVKVHTGYTAGASFMPLAGTSPANLGGLFKTCPRTRFVLLHMGYPYQHELLALAKQYPNVYASLCWAWSISPRETMEFVRRFIHAAPLNKLLAFGGDSVWPTPTYVYSRQMRQWLTRALSAEVAEGFLIEPEAIKIADHILRLNHYACFDIAGRRANIAAAGQSSRPIPA